MLSLMLANITRTCIDDIMTLEDTLWDTLIAVQLLVLTLLNLIWLQSYCVLNVAVSSVLLSFMPMSWIVLVELVVGIAISLLMLSHDLIWIITSHLSHLCNMTKCHLNDIRMTLMVHDISQQGSVTATTAAAAAAAAAAAMIFIVYPAYFSGFTLVWWGLQWRTFGIAVADFNPITQLKATCNAMQAPQAFLHKPKMLCTFSHYSTSRKLACGLFCNALQE